MTFMRARNIIIGGLALLLTSCGQQYKAEKTVDKISGRDFADVGTTRHISDSLIQIMRHRGAPLFKQGISYGNVPQGELFFLRMRFIHKGDTLQNTFYLNQELTEVVAFK